MGSKLLEHLPEVARVLVKLFPGGMAFYATDLERFICKEIHIFDAPMVQVGAEFRKGGPADRAIQTKQMQLLDLDESMYGAAMRVACVPVFDDDDPTKVVGTVGMAVTRRREFAVRNATENFLRGLTEISAAIEETATAAASINQSEKMLNEEIARIYQISEEIVKVLDFIKSVADETKMLGLNAAIEAARAGDAGRGFGVVAEEIRKLSETSKETTEKIRNLTKDIEQRITSAIKSSEVTVRASEEQAAATEEITASIEEMTSLAEELSRLAKEL